ncbi:MAG: hypothetical protein IIW91_03695 [Alistipes sp.]|nr:hypothetical protein [Alistipes sp.]
MSQRTDPIMGFNFFGGGAQTQASNSFNDLQELERRKQELALQQQQILQRHQTQSVTPLWDKIDEEISGLTAEQQQAMYGDDEFADINNKVTAIVQFEQLKLVKAKVEAMPEGKELLQALLAATQRVKGALQTAQKQAYNEYEAFVEASQNNPKLTLDEFRRMRKTKSK